MAGAAPALHDVEALADELTGYQPFHAVRAHLRRGVGDAAGADEDKAAARALAPSAAVRSALDRS